MSKAKLFQRDFTMVVIGQIISLFGNAIVRFALPLYLLDITGSSTIYGTVMAFSMIPVLLISPIGGMIADRVNKRNIMVFLDFGTALLLTVYAVCMGFLNQTVLIAATMMILYGIQSAYQPAVQASIPALADKEELLPANAVINQINSLSGLLGPIIGGILYGAYGLMPVVYVSIGCFVFSAVMEIFIHIPKVEREKGEGILKIVKADFLESIAFVSKEKPVILKVVMIIAAFNLFLSAMLIVGLPVLIKINLGISSQLFGYSQGAMAAGGLLGGILTAVLSKRLNPRKAWLQLLYSAALLLPAGLVFLFPAPPFVAYLVLTASSFLIMMLATIFTIQMISYVQGETPMHLTGKVLACATTLAMCAQPVGQAVYGVLFDLLKSQPWIIVFGTAIISAMIAFASKEIFTHVKQANIEA